YVTFLLGTRLGRPKEAEAAARDTEARLEGLSELDPRRRSNILKFCATGFMSAGKPEEARARYQAALALIEERRPPGSVGPAAAAGGGSAGASDGSEDEDASSRGGLLSHLAWIDAQVGRFSNAFDLFQRAAAAYTQAFGEGNPDVAIFTLDVGVMHY